MALARPLVKQLAFTKFEMSMNYETACRPTPTVTNIQAGRIRTCKLPPNFNRRLALRGESCKAATVKLSQPSGHLPEDWRIKSAVSWLRLPEDL